MFDYDPIFSRQQQPQQQLSATQYPAPNLQPASQYHTTQMQPQFQSQTAATQSSYQTMPNYQFQSFNPQQQQQQQQPPLSHSQPYQFQPSQQATAQAQAPSQQHQQQRMINHQQNLSINSMASLQSSIAEPLTPPDFSHNSKFSPWNHTSVSSNNNTPFNNSTNHYTYQKNYNLNTSNSKLDLLMNNNGNNQDFTGAHQQQKRVMSMPHLQPAISFSNSISGTGNNNDNINKVAAVKGPNMPQVISTATATINSGRRPSPPPGVTYARSNSVNHINMSASSEKSAMDRDVVMRLNSVPFESLGGEILSLSKDQYGCRFLQKKIDESPSNFQFIFKEIYAHAFELMIDPFGNYLIQKILDFCSNAEKNSLIKSCSGNLYSIALNQHGTRALQKMIDCVSTEYQISMIRNALANYVVELIQDLNGNHVIQKCINKFSNEDCQFIIDSICANIIKVSTHKHGCCVLQKCLNNCNPLQLEQLGDEIINNSIVLMQDQFGNYVVQYLLSINNYAINEKLILKIIPSIPILSIQKFSSNVVEKCLKNSSNNVPVQSLMIEEILKPQNLSILIKDQFGNYVIQTSLDVAPDEYKFKLIVSIKPLIATIKTTPFSRRIQSKISMILNSNASVNHLIMAAQLPPQVGVPQQHQQQQHQQLQQQQQQQQQAAGFYNYVPWQPVSNGPVQGDVMYSNNNNSNINGNYYR